MRAPAILASRRFAASSWKGRSRAKNSSHWVSSAKRDETRERRFLKLLDDSRAERRTGPFG